MVGGCVIGFVGAEEVAVLAYIFVAGPLHCRLFLPLLSRSKLLSRMPPLLSRLLLISAIQQPQPVSMDLVHTDCRPSRFRLLQVRDSHAHSATVIGLPV